ncbi:mediator of RNA polymerase II transcription subunit 24 [Euwallacea similis]|uniref:mediator of RNA polymerase II transcription subunit 24 n=1 Tax=Euwallacea similis TaxID=1736056 RepID=UPI00344C55C8
MASKTTSSLTALLLRAWRERWTDLQWGINVKTVLPRGVSGDVYNLADCIIDQVVVGAGANQLALSYLRHSLSAQLISHAAVLRRLSKYEQYNNTHCFASLLEFLEDMLPGVTCFGKSEEIELARSIVVITTWLLNILYHCRSDKILTQKVNQLLKRILSDDFYVSMMCLAKHSEDAIRKSEIDKSDASQLSEFQKMQRICTEVLSILAESDSSIHHIVKLENIDVHMLSLSVHSERLPGFLIQSWLQVQLVGHPGADTSAIIYKLHILQRLKGFSDSRLFAELIRGSLISLFDVSETRCPHASHIGAFIFMNIPHIFQEFSEKSDTSSVTDALDLLLQHSQLLDAIDVNGSCSILTNILEELAKVRLINEEQAKRFLEKRNLPPSVKSDKPPPPSSMQSIIRCAQSSLSGILKTLSSDYHKILDVTLGMLHKVFMGISFEVILAVACSSGQLKALVSRLIPFSECYNNRDSLGQDDSRMQLFDLIFVMLIAIVQNYGASTVLELDGDSLIEQWISSCLVDSYNPKSPTQLLAMSNPAIVEALIQQFNSGDSDFKPNMQLRDIIFNMPAVMHEVLVAWEQGALIASDVKRILDAVKEKTCCLPIAGATYLCSYLRSASPDSVLKPMNMIQQLLACPAALEEENEEDQEEDEGDESQIAQKNVRKKSLRGRWQLTCDIIRKMQKDIQAPSTKSCENLVSRSPATEWFHNAWGRAISRGWLDYNSTKILHCLLSTAGPRWLVNATIQELLKLRFRDQLQRGVDLALAILHVNIVACTTELLSHILPQLLYVDVQSYTLMEPQLSSLAYLTTYCLYTSWDMLSEEKEDEPPMKRPRFDNSESQDSETPSRKLIDSLLQLLAMYEKMQEGGVTPQTHFIFELIKTLVEVKIPSANGILSHIPASLISDLLKTVPEIFSYRMLLHLHDVQIAAGRTNMGKDLCILRNYHLRNACITGSGTKAKVIE